MIWQFLIAAAIAVGFLQLGAVSVWVAVLSAVLKAVVVLLVTAVVCVGIWFAWRRYRNPSVH